jgi:tetratricopeptide (TPR) repeat protein
MRAQGDLPHARRLLERSLEISKQVLGTEIHPDVATSLHQLAGVVQDQGDLPQARCLLERSLEIKKQVLGTEIHPSVATSLHQLAGVVQDQGDLPQARRLLERSLEISKQVLGTEIHPSVAASLHQLAGVVQDQGDLPQARCLLERSLEIRKQVLGTEIHPSVAASLHLLAGVVVAEGRPDEAGALYERVLEIERHVYGSLDQYHSAETEAVYGRLLVHLGRRAEGLKLLRHARDVFETQVPGHRFLPQLKRLLAELDESPPDAVPEPALPDPAELARSALRARSEGSGVSGELRSSLSALSAFGAPHDAVASYLEQLAGGGPVPAIPRDLPDPVLQFLEQVSAAAS